LVKGGGGRWRLPGMAIKNTPKKKKGKNKNFQIKKKKKKKKKIVIRKNKL